MDKELLKVNHAKNIIEVKNVSFSYGENNVLKDISFNVHHGDYLGIVGRNGAGKTTLLKIMLGLLRADSGSVKIFGQNISEMRDRSVLGYVPQKATNFDTNFPATVSEIVLMGRFAKKGLLRKINAEDRRVANDALSHIGMLDYKDRLIGSLSGGEQQRVFIARALVSDPKIILLDEPATGIDRQSEESFYQLIKRLNSEEGRTIVLVSHDLDIVTRDAMHIACIERTLVCHATPEEYMRSGNIITHHRH